MSTTNTLVPKGTVRRQFSEAKSSLIDETLAAIAQIADHEQFDPALVWTAHRLIANESGLDEQTRLHATLATLALLIAIGKGSSRLPLKEPDYFDTMLHRLKARLSAVANELAAKQPSRAESLERAGKTLEKIRQADPASALDPGKLPTLLGKLTDETLPYRPLVLCNGDGALSSERMLRKESALAKAFAAQSAADIEEPSGDEISKAVSALLNSPTRYRSGEEWHDQHLNYEQAQAAILAAHDSLALVTGGPGTGKTTIIVSILRMLVRLGVKPSEVALAAPTGKAAFRMRESIDGQLGSLATEDRTILEADRELRETLPEARTLHRLLEYSPKRDRFWRDADNRLEAKVVICDEASMIDLELMHALVEALPDDARLVLVGDADQLPSVAGGAVFRDLVADTSLLPKTQKPFIEALASEGAANKSDGDKANDPMARFTARLIKSYRMNKEDKDGSRILTFAQAVRDCTSAKDPKLATAMGEAVELGDLTDFGGVALLNHETQRDDFIERWFEQFVTVLPGDDLDSAYDDRKREPDSDNAGTFEMADREFLPASRSDLESIFGHYGNARMLCVTQVFRTGARAINRVMHRLFADRADKDKAKPFLHLEPVMAQQNNYDLGVFNGDQGIVAFVREAGQKRRTMRAIFPRSDGGFRTVPLSQIKPQLEHAYATSIHKAQGSEFSHVAVILPKEKMPLLTKQLLYTGITRASKSVTIFDSAQIFKDGAATPVRRFTGLPEQLDRALACDHEGYDTTKLAEMFEAN